MTGATPLGGPADLLADDLLLDRIAGRREAGNEPVATLLAALAAHADSPLPRRTGRRRVTNKHRYLGAFAALAVAAGGAGVAAAVTLPDNGSMTADRARMEQRTEPSARGGAPDALPSSLVLAGTDASTGAHGLVPARGADGSFVLLPAATPAAPAAASAARPGSGAGTAGAQPGSVGGPAHVAAGAPVPAGGAVAGGRSQTGAAGPPGRAKARPRVRPGGGAATGNAQAGGQQAGGQRPGQPAGAQQPGDQQPVAQQPGTQQPGTQQSDAQQPGDPASQAGSEPVWVADQPHPTATDQTASSPTVAAAVPGVARTVAPGVGRASPPPAARVKAASAR